MQATNIYRAATVAQPQLRVVQNSHEPKKRKTQERGASLVLLRLSIKTRPMVSAERNHNSFLDLFKKTSTLERCPQYLRNKVQYEVRKPKCGRYIMHGLQK